MSTLSDSTVADKSSMSFNTPSLYFEESGSQTESSPFEKKKDRKGIMW